jgi:hypothetical protein
MSDEEVEARLDDDAFLLQLHVKKQKAKGNDGDLAKDHRAKLSPISLS